MSRRGKPIMYIRVASGGREAARIREHCLRRVLEAAGTPLGGAHVYCDLDTPPHVVGRALCLLLEEASIGRVGTVVVDGLGAFGCYEVLVYALMTLERGGADVVVASDLVHDESVAQQLQDEVAARRKEPRLVLCEAGRRGRQPRLP